jgi:hypothetical protein
VQASTLAILERWHLNMKIIPSFEVKARRPEVIYDDDFIL